MPVVTRMRALRARQLSGLPSESKTYPVICGVGLWFRSVGPPNEVLDDDVEDTAMEEIAYRKAATDLGDEDGFAGCSALISRKVPLRWLM